MCIIVAKNAGIKMPSMETLRICFDNNPDGAGFMLADGKAVYGFKGLMSFDEFTKELSKAKKRFGNLDKLSVVMHFRISTHGSVVGGNTHPFPLKGGYREMRKTEWVANQGFAHNGVIFHTTKDPDIKRYNVSDTMVFAKKFINPIARHATIASDREIMDMLFNIADSKLCFMSKKGKISTRGYFTEHDGVLYSNTSFKESKFKIIDPKDWTSGYYYDYSAKNNYSYNLGPNVIERYIYELADELGFEPVVDESIVFFESGEVVSCDDFDMLFTDSSGNLYVYDDENWDFTLYALPDEYSFLE